MNVLLKILNISFHIPDTNGWTVNTEYWLAIYRLSPMHWTKLLNHLIYRECKIKSSLSLRMEKKNSIHLKTQSQNFAMNVLQQTESIYLKAERFLHVHDLQNGTKFGDVWTMVYRSYIAEQSQHDSFNVELWQFNSIQFFTSFHKGQYNFNCLSNYLYQ